MKESKGEGLMEKTVQIQCKVWTLFIIRLYARIMDIDRFFIVELE